MPNKTTNSICLLLVATALSITGNVYAEIAPANPNALRAQQDGSITGTVVDAYGPVIGASVIIKGTTTGNITDLDGKFTLEGLQNGDVIQISYVGYVTQEIVYNGQATIDVTLKEDSEQLEEVVVTALGLKREEKALGYAMTELKGDDLKAANSISPIAGLQGKVAGVDIAASDGGIFGATKIQIRGASTMGDNNQPIYVVDGVILDNDISGNDDLNWGQDSNDYGNELKNLNPDDFESVSVLKGAAATALYGSRGLNGAVIITTKSGKAGSGLGVSFSQSVGIDHAYKTPAIQTTYGDGMIVGYADTDGNGSIWDPFQFTVNQQGQHTLINTYGFGFGPRYDGSQIENYDGTMTTYSPIKNNMLDMYELGVNTNTNVAIHGGNDKTTFYSSLSYKHASSNTPNNTFERYSLLLKGTHKLSDRVDVAASVTFANSTPRNAARNVGEEFVYGNYTPLYDANYFKDKYLGEHGGLASTEYGDKYGNVPGKDYWFQINHYDYRQKETVIRPTFEVNVQLFDWLKFKADGNMNYYYTRAEDKQLGTGFANDGGYFAISQNSKEQTTFGGTLTWNKTFKEDWYVGGFARFEYYNTISNYYKVYTDGGMVVPGQWFVDNSKNPKKSEGGIQTQKRMLSAIVALNLGWKNQVYLDLTGRNDWSSALVYSNGTGNHSYFYPSVSGSWIISETFRDRLPEWISFLKVRGSWAQVGNDTDPYYVNQAYGFSSIELPSGGNIYTNTLDMIMKSADLKPERKNAWEIGLDWRMFNNRFNIDATYYRENTKDQIMEIAEPSISGVSTQLINAGNIQNQGVELAINTTPYQNKDWQWDLNFTWTKNISKIVELHPDAAEYIELQGQVNAYDYRIGSVAKVGSTYGMLMTDILPARDDQGRMILTYNDSRRAAYAQRSGVVEELGDMTPDFLGSMNTTLRWKDLSLYVGLDMRIGGLVAMYSNRYGSYAGWTESSLAYRDEEHGGLTFTSQYADSKDITYHDGVVLDGVFADGTVVTGIDGQAHDISGMSHQEAIDAGIIEPTHASAYHFYTNDWGTGTINDDWVHELSYIALRDVSLNYRLPTTWAEKIKAKSLNVGFSMRNVCYLYNSLPNGINPETVRGNRSAEFRIRGYEPFIRNYTFNVSVEF